MEDLSENENTVAVLTIYYKEKQLTNLVGKSSVSCPLKPSDSAPLKHSTMPP